MADWDSVFGSLNQRGALDRSAGDRRQVSLSSVYKWFAAKKKKRREKTGFKVAFIATWNQSQARMPKQAARFSVPVLLGIGLARSPNAFVTFNIFPSRFENHHVHNEKNCEKEIIEDESF